MITRLTVTAFGLAALFSISPARADYLVYTNRASFESAITAEKTETFNELGENFQNFGATGLGKSNGLNHNISVTGSNSFLYSTSAPALAGYYPNDSTYLLGPVSTASTDGLTVTLPAKADSAAGADIGVFASKSVVSLLVTTSDGSSFTSKVAVDASASRSNLGFLGVVLTTPGDYVTSLTFSAAVGSNQNVVLDNVSFGFAPATVPEPASMALMVTGSLVLAGAALRRRLREKLA